MKKLKLNFPLKLLLIPFLALFVCALVITSIFGFNTSVEFGGGKRLTARVTEVTSVSKTRDQIVSVLNSNGLRVEYSYVEDKIGETNLVFMMKGNSNADYSAVISKISDKTALAASDLSDFETVRGSINATAITLFGVGVIVFCVIAFALSAIRFKTTGALTLLISTLGTFLLHLSLLSLTRLPIGTPSLVTIIISVITAMVITLVILEGVRVRNKSRANADLNESEIVALSANDAVKPSVMFVSFLLLFSVVLLFAGANLVKFFALANIFGLLVSVYVGLFISSSVYTLFLEVANIRTKQRVSKNPELTKKKKK